MITVLIVSGGGFQGLGLVDSLREIENLRIIVFDIYQDNPTRYACDHYLLAPPIAEIEAFEAFIVAQIRYYKISVVFPVTGYELEALARLAPIIKLEGAITAISTSKLLKILSDKIETNLYLQNSGLPVLPAIIPQQHDYSYILLGKPRYGWGGKGIKTLENHADAKKLSYSQNFDDYLWVRQIENFIEYSADFAIGPGGPLPNIILRRRVRTCGGFATVSESIPDLSLHALIKKLADILYHDGGFGLFNIQIISKNGESWISDINPRWGTSATHGISEGVNLPAAFLEAALNQSIEHRRPYARPVRTARRLTDFSIPTLHTKPRSVVFDLDDTLIDHKRWTFSKLMLAKESCPEINIPHEPFQMIALSLIEEGERARLIDSIIKHLRLNQHQHGLLLEAYRSSRVETIPLFPDVVPTLSALREAGLRLALLTDNPPSTQMQKIEGAGLTDYFDCIVFSRQIGAEKPAPESFQFVAKQLGLPIHDLAMVGDHPFRDSVGAISAGYGHAFTLARPGVFLNPNKHLFQFVPDSIACKIYTIQGLSAVRYAVIDK